MVAPVISAAIALPIAAGRRPPDPRWGVSGDGSVTSLDALMILQAAAGNIKLGPLEELIYILHDNIQYTAVECHESA